MNWSSSQYLKFENERTQPVRDLLAHIPNPSAIRAADIGCGPGNSTELLQRRFPDAAITGVDSSEDMIAAAQKRLPRVQFEVVNIAEWQAAGGPFDVILANAVLQWLPDHAALLSALLAKLAPGGSLAVQIPDNLEEPAHRLMREVASNGAWREKLVGAAKRLENQRSASWYYSVLRESGAAVDVWRTTYYHALAGGAADVVEWFKATGLLPFLQPLSDAERVDFLREYEAAVAEAYPALADGTILLPFPRLFFVATVK